MAQPWAAEFKKEGRLRHPPTGFDLSSQEQFIRCPRLPKPWPITPKSLPRSLPKPRYTTLPYLNLVALVRGGQGRRCMSVRLRGRRSDVCQGVSPKKGAHALAIHCVHSINLEHNHMRTYLQRHLPTANKCNTYQTYRPTHTYRPIHTYNCSQTLVTGRFSRYLKAEVPAHLMAHAMRT
jgi:hypothetical protein